MANTPENPVRVSMVVGAQDVTALMERIGGFAAERSLSIQFDRPALGSLALSTEGIDFTADQPPAYNPDLVELKPSRGQPPVATIPVEKAATFAESNGIHKGVAVRAFRHVHRALHGIAEAEDFFQVIPGREPWEIIKADRFDALMDLFPQLKTRNLGPCSHKLLEAINAQLLVSP